MFWNTPPESATVQSRILTRGQATVQDGLCHAIMKASGNGRRFDLAHQSTTTPRTRSAP